MSYGIGIIIRKEDIEKTKIPYDFCEWMLPVQNKLEPLICQKNFIKWHKEMEEEKKVTTLEKLKTAPCDCICIIDKDGNFSLLPECQPIVQEYGSQLKDHLTIIR